MSKNLLKCQQIIFFFTIFKSLQKSLLLPPGRPCPWCRPPPVAPSRPGPTPAAASCPGGTAECRPDTVILVKSRGKVWYSFFWCYGGDHWEEQTAVQTIFSFAGNLWFFSHCLMLHLHNLWNPSTSEVWTVPTIPYHFKTALLVQKLWRCKDRVGKGEGFVKKWMELARVSL